MQIHVSKTILALIYEINDVVIGMAATTVFIDSFDLLLGL
jgi:hypothetical protein